MKGNKNVKVILLRFSKNNYIRYLNVSYVILLHFLVTTAWHVLG
jgi:hypothetical protein